MENRKGFTDMKNELVVSTRDHNVGETIKDGFVQNVQNDVRTHLESNSLVVPSTSKKPSFSVSTNASFSLALHQGLVVEFKNIN